MNETLYELSAFVKNEQGSKPFHLNIAGLDTAEEQDDYCCLVHAPYLFKKDKRIFGIDKSQAIELSLDFVKTMLGDDVLIDEQGSVIELNP